MADLTDVTDDSFDQRRLAGTRWLVRPALVVVGYVLLFAGIVTGYQQTGAMTVDAIVTEFELLNWMTLCAVFISSVVFAPSVIRHPKRLWTFLREFARDRFAVIGLVGLIGIGLVAIFGPSLFGRPEFDPGVTYNPPVATTIDVWVPTNCVGEATSDSCYGSWEYPFGTDKQGYDVGLLVISGLRTSLQVGLTAAVIAGGIGTMVGIVAGTAGGWVDALLMRYVDLQSALPAFFAYVFIWTIVSGGLILMVIVFGLLSWGGLARLVRSEVLQIKEEQYLQSARAAGAGTFYRIRYHILPNVGTSVLIPLSTLVPLYILYEAALSFLGFGETQPTIFSLGDQIAEGFASSGFVPNWWDVWWTAVVPAAALTVVVLCILVVGDRVVEVADPRQD